MAENDQISITSRDDEAAESRENESQETTVIDVHAPHGGMHTWKDFWIHLGTIAAGLLIAISLEQSVEWMHRLHERHQLQHDLRDEALMNRDAALTDDAVYRKVIAWLLEIQRGVDEARTAGAKSAFVYPERPDGVPDSPRYAAYHVLNSETWTTAKESAQVSLLPRDEARIYARLYLQADQVQAMRERVRELGIEQGAFEIRYSRGTYPAAFNLSKLTPEQLDEYGKILANELENVHIAMSRLTLFEVVNDYVLSGGTSEVEARKALVNANMRH